jgi:hypothetical protein
MGSETGIEYCYEATAGGKPWQKERFTMLGQPAEPSPTENPTF